jgi:hypothetical protein
VEGEDVAGKTNGDARHEIHTAPQNNYMTTEWQSWVKAPLSTTLRYRHVLAGLRLRDC